MVATKGFQNAVASVVGTDSLLAKGAGAELKVMLYTNDVSPTEFSVFEDFTPLDDGGAPIVQTVGLGAQIPFYDVLTSSWKIRLREPVSGWLWQANDLAVVPQAVNGYLITDHANTLLYAKKFDAPVSFNDTLDSFMIPEIDLEFLPGIFR